MAELENQEVETELDLDTTENEDIETEETSTDDPDEISYETALEWKRKAERLEKAEKKLVELKKQVKTQTKTPEWEFITKKELEIEKFITKNPDLEEYKTDLQTYLDKGLSLNEAKTLLENSDKVLQNRRKTDELNITTTDWEPSKRVYKISEIENMSQSEYNKFMDLKAQWKVKVV